MKKIYKIKDKGFTLVELLVVIIILAILVTIGIYSINNVINTSDNKLSETSKKLIIDAANTYALEFRNSDKWDEAKNEDGSTSFCVSLESLINAGYYVGNNKEINKYKNDYVIKVDLVDGVFNYKIIKISETNKYCSYYSGNSDINNGTGAIDVTDENNEKIGDLKFKVDGIDDYNYMATIDFKAILGLKDIEVDAPLYVAIVLDNSGSMTANSGWDKAKEAAMNLSEEIINASDSSYVALVQYTDSVKLKRDFAHAPLSTSNFNLATGYTNTSGGLAMAASIFEGIKDKENADFYTILLYDGEPTHYSFFYTPGKWLYPYSNDDNYYIKFNDYDRRNSTCNTQDCVSYIVNASKYLKNNLNSKLITIGYNMQTSSSVTEDDLINMKEASTQDNSFCANSSYTKKVTKYSNNVYTNKPTDIKSNQIVYPFKLSGSSLVSTNAGIPNSISQVRLKVDLTNRSNYSFTFNTTVNSSGTNNFGYLMGGFQQSVPFSEFQSCQNNATYQRVDNTNYICFTGSRTYSGYGQGFYQDSIGYFNFGYSKYGNTYGGNDKFTINSFTVDGPSTTPMNLSGRTSFSNGQDITKPFLQSGSSIVSSNQNINYSQSYANNEIDLTNESGTYFLDVNASVSSNYGHNLGFVYVDSNNYNPIIPLMEKYYNGTTYETYIPNNVDSLCNRSNGKCESGVYNKTYTFVLTGGKKNYIHYIYNRQNVSGNNDNFTINNIKLYKLTDNIYSGTVFGTGKEYLSDLITPSSYGFIQSGTGIISNSKEVSSSQAHSYNKLDLSSFSSSQKITVGFNIYASSEKNNDYGNIVITTSPNLPTLVNGSCADSADGFCVASISGYNSGNYYKTIDGGKIYYIHYIYYKNGSINSANDNFGIQNIKIYKVESNSNSAYPLNTSNYYNNLNQGKNYYFVESNGTYTSNNKGTFNSVAHSYYKVDLSGYSGTYYLSMGTTISSSSGYGMIAITTSPNTPMLAESFTPSNNNEGLYAIPVPWASGNTQKNYTMNLYGGKTYYVHFFYLKNRVIADNYGDYFRIDSINVYTSASKTLTFPISSDYSFISVETPKNYPFEAIDNKYVSSNKDDAYTLAESYVKIDLSSYPSSKTYKLVTNATINSSSDSYGGLILTTSPSTPKIYKGIYDSTYYPDNLVSYFGNALTGKSTKDYIVNINGGQVYYLHFTYYKGYYHEYGYENQFTINSINVFENSTEESNSYCYYDSSSDQIYNLFDNIISKKIIESVEKFSAKKAVLTLTPGKLDNGYGFKVLNESNELVNKITKEIDLSNVSSTQDAIIDISGKYHLVVDDKLFDECKEKNKNSSNSAVSCTATLKIFDIKIDLFDSNNKLQKTITVDNAPTVTISSKIHDTVN